MITLPYAYMPGRIWASVLCRSISARSVRLLTLRAHDVRVTLARIGWSRNALTSTLAFVPFGT